MSDEIPVHLPIMVHKDLLYHHPRNSNKQSKNMFKELRESIRNNGFDESLTVSPRLDDEDGYYVVSGNHRLDAGIAEGMIEFPCVVRSDWDEVQQQIELVRRNYIRGELDKTSFTHAVDAIVQEKEISIDEVRDLMGFEDITTFLKLYQQEESQIQEAITSIQSDQKTQAPAVRMMDDVGVILSAILEKYGDTVPFSFLIFPAGNKKHMYIAANPALVRTMQEIGQYALTNNIDINVALSGLLAIGKHYSHMNTGNDNIEHIVSEGSKPGDVEEF